MIQVGIIGAGRIGQVHMRSIASGVPNAVIRSLADPLLSKETEQLAKSIGIEHIYSDYHDIIDDPKIDAVLICSPTDLHAKVSVEAIHAGKHVFCEKPVDHELAKIDLVEAALKASGKNLKYQVGFNRRYDHNFRALRKAVLAGKIGDVQFVRVSSRDPQPPHAGFIASSGGLFLDMMIHDLDMIRYLSGSEVVEVFAQGAVLIDPAIGQAGDVDTATVSARMANGALALIDNSRQAVYGYDQRAEVFGSKGSVQNANDLPSTMVLSTVDGITAEKPLWFFLERYMASYQAEVRAFIDSIEQDTETEVGIADGRRTIQIALACKKSLAENRPVRIDEI
jgi:myo-inositol 2-dehydrogenase / D-chiro-inositol 1-dehydrogenase